LSDSDISILSAVTFEGRELNSRYAWRHSPFGLNIRRILLGNACALAVGLAMTLGASPARAQYPFWYSPVHRPQPPVYRRRLVRKHVEETSKVNRLPFGDIPKGPLQIFVSIDQQKLHFYSDGVHVADEPVATGVPGHLTPLGVFNVIERDRYHHSNIYDNAPMPFMQRITWSGVALHEGVGLGHQASHGCIRMPHDFAARLWMLPTMGMGVIIARPELRPEDFSDPHLFVHSDKPPASAASRQSSETAQAADPAMKTDASDPAAAPAGAPHAAEVASAADANIGVATAPTPAKTEQPSQAAPAAEATPPAAKATAVPAPSDSAGATASAPPASAASDGKSTAAAAPPPSSPPPSSPPSAAAATATTAQSGNTPAASPAAAAMPANSATAQAPAAASAPMASAPAAPDAANPAASANIAAPVEDIPLPLSKPTRIAEGSSGPLAIFISRKTGKIYVRQNFTPLFDAPVTIEHPDQPLGTHVFTAMDYLPDHAAFHWTVVNLPADGPKAAEHWKYVRDRYGRIRRIRVEEPAPAADIGPPETPQGALARIQIPQDVIDQISRLIVPGSSLTISDQGLGSETGDGTDFIVVSR